MSAPHPNTWLAFAGEQCLTKGSPAAVLETVYTFRASHTQAVLIFDAHTSRVVDIDWRGDLAAVQVRYAEPNFTTEPRSVGRPKLGVAAKEVTLLPRHWEWLAQQSGGVSVALRKLVEQALRAEDGEAGNKRQAQDACYRFMQALAGDLPAYEEALRALYANDFAKLDAQIELWPQDIKAHILELAQRAMH